MQSEANWFIIKFYNIEAKRICSIMILYLKQQQKSELSFFLKKKGKKRKGLIVNYRSFVHYQYKLPPKHQMQCKLGRECSESDNQQFEKKHNF